MAKAELEQAIADLGLVITADFVPYSKSRSFKPGAKVSERNLNWKVALKRMAKIDGSYKPGSERTILTVDYSAGIGHCPAYKSHKPGTLRWSLYNEEAYVYETEHGKQYREHSVLSNGPKILPDTCDVIASLILDADVINHSSFESWASDFGYDTDSRKAETMYRECLNIALALRNGIGDAGLAQLQKAAEDY